MNDITIYEYFKDYPDVVSVDELQAMLRIGRNSAYDLLRSGAIQTLKIGKKYIIPKLNVVKYIICSLTAS